MLVHFTRRNCSFVEVGAKSGTFINSDVDLTIVLFFGMVTYVSYIFRLRSPSKVFAFHFAYVSAKSLADLARALSLLVPRRLLHVALGSLSTLSSSSCAAIWRSGARVHEPKRAVQCRSSSDSISHSASTSPTSFFSSGVPSFLSGSRRPLGGMSSFISSHDFIPGIVTSLPSGYT